MIKEIKAHAKLNLFLHITGKRDDDYHLVESIIVFLDLCDVITVKESDSLTLSISGVFASAIQNDENNLIIKAANALQNYCNLKDLNIAINLEKNIPVGSGLGGGSSDAAAIMKLLNNFYNLGLSLEKLQDIGLTLGADIPICLYGKSAFVSGIGEIINPVELNNIKNILLVNPNIFLSTREVFLGYDSNKFRSNGAIGNIDYINKLNSFNNDLELSAKKIAPELNKVIAKIATQEGCKVSRMSGSGATCFGWFETKEQTLRAGQSIKKSHPDWWVRSCEVV